MKKLKRYKVKFEEDGTMKPKVYLSACELCENNWQTIIVITRDECTFTANNRVRKVLTQKKNMFLRTKGWRQGILTIEFFFHYGPLNFTSLILEKREKIVHQGRLQKIEAVKIFEYRKNNDSY